MLKSPNNIEKELNERIKELNCLYGMAKLSERSRDFSEFLKLLADFLPRSWQYSRDACARIVFQKKIYESKRFRATKWSQSEPILIHRKKVGTVTVFYVRKRPEANEGPFLNEERKLLEAVASRIAEIGARSVLEENLTRTNRELEQERKALHEANTTLRSVLSAIEIEKKQIEKNMSDNIGKLVLPTVNALMPSLSKDQQVILDIIRQNLEEIVSPHTLAMSRFHSLTQIELSICNMIKSGLRTKEIAQFRKVSEATIHRQRENIRRKLKITNRPVNLSNYLQGLGDEIEIQET